MKTSMKSNGQNSFSQGLIEYAAGNIKQTFLWGLLFSIISVILDKLCYVIPAGVGQNVICIIAVGAGAVVIVLLCKFTIQTVFSLLSAAFGFGWHCGPLTTKQLRRSVYAGGVTEKETFGCDYVYWKCLFMKRYLEDVKL